jgi:hypothetical protein
MDNQTLLVVCGVNGMLENGRHSNSGKDGVIFIYSKAITVRDKFYKTRIQDVASIVSHLIGVSTSN